MEEPFQAERMVEYAGRKTITFCVYPRLNDFSSSVQAHSYMLLLTRNKNIA